MNITINIRELNISYFSVQNNKKINNNLPTLHVNFINYLKSHYSLIRYNYRPPFSLLL
jgi:hypothetical protein